MNEFSNSLQRTMSLFYAALLTLGGAEIAPLVMKSDFQEANWLWPAMWLNSDTIVLLPILFLIFIAATTHSVFRPTSQTSRATSAFSFFILLAALYSFGKINHQMYGFMHVSFVFALISFRRPDTLYSMFRLSLIAFLGTYFLSGLWKLRFLVSAFFFSWSTYSPLQGTLLHNKLQQFSTQPPLLTQYINEPLALLIWCGIILFEIGILFVAFFPRLHKTGGMMIVLFHLSTILALSIFYVPAAILSAIMLINSPANKS